MADPEQALCTCRCAWSSSSANAFVNKQYVCRFTHRMGNSIYLKGWSASSVTTHGDMLEACR